MRTSTFLRRGQRRIFAAQAAGRIAGGAARGSSAVTGVVRHVLWYGTYLVDGRRGARTPGEGPPRGGSG